jgi:hypothetical protein
MSNDTALSIILLCLLAMTFLTGVMLGALRRDRDWRIFLADQRSADDSHWETTIRE